eukprot:TRINITY_DN2538_c0_g1_i2.p2 TRINITY_DN2538_c0_g1~~TRINITY_DN2538_c0_g1_i2.p2  ORF type:complete len:306 (+),score=73.17 TRINITY_DN2538_c0_g1_i2:172-1089(+)
MSRVFIPLLISVFITCLRAQSTPVNFVAPETRHIRPLYRFPTSKYYTLMSKFVRQKLGVQEAYCECSSLQGPRCLYNSIPKDFESIAGLNMEMVEGSGMGGNGIKIVVSDAMNIEADLAKAIEEALINVQQGGIGEANIEVELDEMDLSSMFDEKVVYNLANQLAGQLGDNDVDMIYEELQATLADPNSVQVKYFDLRPTSPRQNNDKEKSNNVEDDDEYMDPDEVEEAPQKTPQNNDQNGKQLQGEKVVIERFGTDELTQNFLNSEAFNQVLKKALNLGVGDLEKIEKALQKGAGNVEQKADDE